MSKRKNIAAAIGGPEEWKMYSSYHIKVDPLQDDRATEIRICDFRRPHMRAFHCCWWSFFIAFFTWFSISPLLGGIREDLGLTKDQIWNSTIASVGGTIGIRIILGPLCDKYGARDLFSILLCLSSIPAACVGFVKSGRGLCILRLFIGMAGGSFVMTEYWMSTMFAKEVVGTANAMVAGWGNLGAGVTRLVIGSALLPIFGAIFGDSEKAWRTVCILPAVVAFITGVVLPFVTDDSPKGAYKDLKRNGTKREVSATESFKKGTLDFNTWILFIQYAACFGVELAMNNAAALYFKDVFGQSNESAAAIASIFGWMNLFARGLGGLFSDKMNASRGMRGRIIAQTVLLLGEGVMVLVFAQSTNFGSAITALIIFSMFVQSAEGTSFGIVPYIVPSCTGTVTGIVGAGGNVGATVFALLFKELEYGQAFKIMGWFVIGSAALSGFINIKEEKKKISSKFSSAEDS